MKVCILLFFLQLFPILSGKKKKARHLNKYPNIKTSKSVLSSLFNELEVSVQNFNGRKHRVIPFAFVYSCIFSNTKLFKTRLMKSKNEATSLFHGLKVSGGHKSPIRRSIECSIEKFIK
jgi:hypothetical protein